MSVDSRPLRAGIIGCGAIAQEAHIPGLLAAGVEIGAVCDANEARAREIGNRLDVAAVHTEVRELLNVPDIDLVTVALPNGFHAPVAVAALGAGKHVLCEKPMSVDSVGAEAMLAAARTSGKLLSVNQFVRAVRDGEPLLVLPEQTLLTTRILERIVESAAARSELPFDPG